jgi:hypothetical protein
MTDADTVSDGASENGGASEHDGGTGEQDMPPASHFEDFNEWARIDRLLDAVELVKTDHREEARTLLRELIREDNNFEDAWLWMSVAVDSLDQSSLCLDNVLRINPRNYEAAGALYRIRIPEILRDKRRANLRTVRDIAFGIMWVLALLSLLGVIMTFATAT